MVDHALFHTDGYGERRGDGTGGEDLPSNVEPVTPMLARKSRAA